MPDRTDCYLELGGNVPRVVANAIVSDEFLPHDRANTELPSSEPNAASLGLQVWNVRYQDVSYGNIPDDLRDLLMKHNVPFTWRWLAGGEYGPGIQWWVPGMEKTREVYVDHDGAEYVTITYIRQRAALEPGLSLSDFLGSLDLVPNLPPCRFIEDGSPIKTGPDPLPQTFTLIGNCEDGYPWSKVVEATSAAYARTLAPSGVTVTAVVVGRCLLAA